MSNLRKVIQEELSNIFQSVEQTDQEMASRKRKDRMKKVDTNNDTEEQWYQNQKHENVRSRLRQIVVEEYQTLREDPETSIEERSGIKDFEIPEGTSGRWYMNEDGEPDTEKIEEAAKRATKRLLNR